jgi:hypothetical protein
MGSSRRFGVSRRFVDRVMRDFENAFNPGIAERAE